MDTVSVGFLCDEAVLEFDGEKRCVFDAAVGTCVAIRLVVSRDSVVSDPSTAAVDRCIALL